MSGSVTAWIRVPSVRWNADHIQSLAHQSRVPHEWSRWPGPDTAISTPSMTTVPSTRQGIS